MVFNMVHIKMTLLRVHRKTVLNMAPSKMTLNVALENDT